MERAGKGRSALSALITLFNNIDAIRMHLPAIRVHGVVTHGGVVETSYRISEGLFTLRAKNPKA